MPSQAESAIKRAVTKIVLGSEFFGVLMMKLKVLEVPEHMAKQYNTMATDGKVIWWHENFVNSIDDREIIAVLIHELLHCAFMHQFRIKGRNPIVWGAATDYAINPIVAKNYLLPTPHLDEKKYHNKSAEEIYDMLLQENPGAAALDELTKKGAGMGVVVPIGELSGDVDNNAVGAEEIDWKSAVTQAISQAKSQGTLPGGLEGLVEATLKPQIPWREILYNFLSHTVPGRYNWKMRSNRSVSMGMYMPRRGKIKNGDLVIGIDTSGSFSDKECEIALSEIAWIVNEMKPRQTVIIQCDAAIRGKVKTYEQGEDFPTKVHIHGRGGTDFRPPFKYVEEHPEIEPDAFIYITDGYGPFPEEHTVPYPVLWAITNKDVEAPFGEQLYLHVD